jgi:hypothetical protein
MFDSLNEQMKRDERLSRSLMERSLEAAGVLAISILLFVVLYAAIVFLE